MNNSTRALYEKKLREVMSKSRRTQPQTDRTYYREEEDITYIQHRRPHKELTNSDVNGVAVWRIARKSGSQFGVDPIHTAVAALVGALQICECQIHSHLSRVGSLGDNPCETSTTRDVQRKATVKLSTKHSSILQIPIEHTHGAPLIPLAHFHSPVTALNRFITHKPGYPISHETRVARLQAPQERTSLSVSATQRLEVLERGGKSAINRSTTVY
ncbi:hypothetical protein DNTS_014148 [Danionella cerebrum]|uniref:Uncharacterized protein n=1 Tax=Danionella cerebrum TaxID=2873325 RepID=A0A553PZW1_9TELE|nr:hypothetical protein DNTS_014148 [Danionella translucida]